MKPTQSIAEQWAEVVQFYEDTHPAHRQEPMQDLVRAVAEAGVANSLRPGHSHFTLIVSRSDKTAAQTSFLDQTRLSAEYWHEVDKFRLRFRWIKGIPYDEKWCDLAEAQATLRFLFQQMQNREETLS